jgi:ABC-type sugar transport system ATPase subunit
MPGEPVLELADISAPGLRGITLVLREGEILGLAGLAGQGQEDVLRVVFGLTRPAGGRMSLAGEPYRPRTPRAAQARGIGFVPLDRKSEGLFLSKSMRFNLGVVAREIAVTPARIVSRRRERAFVRRQIEAIDIRPPEPAMRVGALSGGNQQKVLFQRVMAERPRLLLLADVTRGVDIQTKKELYAQVRAAADQGTAVLFYSTDTEELTGLCSRVAVFQRGRVVRELAGSALSRDAIVAASLAGSGTADAA